jgi:secreted trypsin-like serine protease
MVYAFLSNGSGARTCSGAYFAPRVVLTAAHCLQDVREVFVYYGDPNPGMLDAVVRGNVVKTDGRGPYSNGCFGDSGSPLLVTQYGQTYIAGVSSFVGLYCEDYSL